MLPTVALAAPLVVALLLAPLPAHADRRWFLAPWVALGVAEVVLALVLWAGTGPVGYAGELAVPWIPAFGVGYHVGVDGLSLPLVAMTAVVFLAVAVVSWRPARRDAGPGTPGTKAWVLLFLALETAAIGVFVALDLVLFFVFFDVSIALMYFVIAGWGHGAGRRRSALLFFLYTFLGSLVMLLGFLALAGSARPITFDIPALLAAQPLAGRGLAGGLVLLAIGVGLAIKTPVVPVHTWLPPAHTDAPAAGSAVLAAVLLKMGTYGFLRIAMPLLPGPWRSAAVAIMIVGAVSVLWGALVALAQRDLKRMVALTSVNHMGYVLLALGAAGVLAAGPQARAVATTGATVQMVSHGLISAALFLLLGVLHDRGGTHEAASWSGLAGPMPRFAVAFTLAAFAALGLPGFSGFVAEFSVLTGALPAQAVITVVAASGIVVTAALFLRAVGQVVLGAPRLPSGTGEAPDLRGPELLAVAPLLALAVVIGVLPALVTGVIDPAAAALTEVLAR